MKDQQIKFLESLLLNRDQLESTLVTNEIFMIVKASKYLRKLKTCNEIIRRISSKLMKKT